MTVTLQSLFAAATTAHRAGDTLRAAALYRQILSTSRAYPDVLHQLGLIEHQNGNNAEAAALIREAIAIAPDQSVYHNNLSSTLIALGDFLGARAAAEKALSLNTDYGQAYANLGTAHVGAGNSEAAAVAFRRASWLNPENAFAHFWLGRTLQDQGKFEEAAASYGTVIGLAPRFADAHCNLGYVLGMSGDTDAAVRHCRRAIELSPTYADAYNNLGYFLQLQSDFVGAKAAYEAAIAHYPDFAEAFNNLGNMYKDLGDLTAAADAYRKALVLKPGLARALYNIADIKTFRGRDDDFQAVAAQVAAPGTTPEQLTYLHFALGKALDDIGDYSGAFSHYNAGNKLKRAAVVYDESFLLGYFRDMQKNYDAALLARLAGVGAASAAPIFIVGAPRSGTTLVEQILASHAKILGSGERNDFNAAIASVLPPAAVGARAAALDARNLRALGEDYLARLPALDGGHTRITDKMPANFMHLGLIHLALPRAKIVHVVRDPADTCVSCYLKLFEIGQEFTYDLGELGRYYSGYRRLMDHWGRVLGTAVYEISYERLIADLEGETRRLLEYCELDWDPACLDFHKTVRAVQTASATQVRQPIYTRSIGRWRHYESHLAPLLAALGDM